MRDRLFGNSHRTRVLAGLVLATALLGMTLTLRAGRSQSQEAPAKRNAAEILDGFRHVEAASVSDALEQVTGKKMYMTHRMRPIFSTKFAGYALTVKLKKEANDDPTALQGMLTAIDSGDADSVYVMVVEDGADIAGMGGLGGD
jgi:regulator of RNase E activity RraA